MLKNALFFGKKKKNRHSVGAPPPNPRWPPVIGSSPPDPPVDTTPASLAPVT